MRTGPVLKSIEWNKETVSDFDAVLISTNHSTINYKELAEWSECIIDTRMRCVGLRLKVMLTYLRLNESKMTVVVKKFKIQD